MEKLTKAQEELLRAIQSGVTLRYYPASFVWNTKVYYLRSDTNQRCTIAADALIKAGLLRKSCGQSGWTFRLTEKGRTWPSSPEETTA